MGVWGHGPFSNDDAQDWIAELEATGAPLIIKTLDLYAEGYLEAPEGSRIIAAAEVVAAAFGFPSSDFPEALRAPTMDVQATITRMSGIREKAMLALNRVLADESELNELWLESAERYELWLQSVRNLQVRLSK